MPLRLRVTSDNRTRFGDGRHVKDFANHGGTIGLDIISFDGIQVGDKDFKALLTKIREDKPDVVLLDILIEGDNGFEFCRALRRMFKVGNYNVRDGLDDYDDDYSQLTQMAPETGERMRQWLRQERDKVLSPDDPASESSTVQPADPAAEDDANATSPEDVAQTERSALADEEKAPNDPLRPPGVST